LRIKAKPPELRKKEIDMRHQSKTPDRQSGNQNGDSKEYLFDKPRNVRILFVCYYSSLFILLITEFLIHKHGYLPWEEWPEFYAVFGFVACVVLVVVAKYFLRPLVKRREDYYD
jgi:hypothetical protein